MTVVKKKLKLVTLKHHIQSNPFSKQNPNYVLIMNTGVNKYDLCLPSGSSAVHMSPKKLILERQHQDTKDEKS